MEEELVVKLREDVAKRDKLLLQLKIKAKSEFAKMVASNASLKKELAERDRRIDEFSRNGFEKDIEERLAEVKRASKETLRSYRMNHQREIQSLSNDAKKTKMNLENLKKINNKLQKSNVTFRKKLKALEETLLYRNEKIESLSSEIMVHKEEKDRVSKRQHRMSQEEIEELEARKSEVVHLKKKHLNSKNEAVKIAMRYEDLKEQHFRFTKALKFVLIPRARDISSMVKRIQANSRDAIKFSRRRVSDDMDSKFTLEITTDNDDEVEMELAKICNSKSSNNQQQDGCETLGRFMQRTIEELETLSDSVHKLIDSQKEEAAGGGYNGDRNNESCCSAIFRVILGRSGGGRSSSSTSRGRGGDRREYEIVENIR